MNTTIGDWSFWHRKVNDMGYRLHLEQNKNYILELHLASLGEEPELPQWLQKEFDRKDQENA